ncbi:MAG: long-chain fatty acid--CoA ligase [Kineosporiaceae bacterium]|nr:long-chain fatty acid--CoA ligase [Kineosporiaceae bacterium]
MTKQTLATLFAERVQLLPGQEAFRTPTASGWTSLTWSQTDAVAREIAAGLLAHELDTEDRVAILSSTRLEWILVDLAVVLAGGATAAIYPNTQESDVAYIVGDSGAVIVVAEDALQVGKLRHARPQLDAVRLVVVLDPSGLSEAAADGTWDDGWVITLEELKARGRRHVESHPTAVDDAVAGISSDHLSTLIYTSGTTGRPKGVELTHSNWVYLAEAVEATHVVQHEDLQFLWLPLSHSFGKLLLAAQYRIGFATAVDGRIDKIVENLATIQPTFMAAAPRIFEKVHARVNALTADEGGAKKIIFDWAFRVGTECVRREQAGRSIPPILGLQRTLADKLVFTKIRARLGGRIENLISGSAALAPAVAEWFAAAGLPILEGYGMTETTGACMVNRPGKVRIGTVGIPFDGTEARVAADGELLIRSAGIMRGYHNLPEQTAEVLSPDGWLATGDVAEIDTDGYVRITDRKKDLVKTSGGKYIAPSLIEGSIKAASPMIGQVIVVADNRKFPGALIALDTEAAAAWGQANGVAPEEVPNDPRIRELVQEALDEVNLSLNRWEQIKQFRLLPRELDVDNGELTPSLKIKRAAVVRDYAALIDQMYT